MTPQRSSARKFRVTSEMLQKAAHSHNAWQELYVALQERLRIQIRPEIATQANIKISEDSKWQPA
jgi:hypothetical protein